MSKLSFPQRVAKTTGGEVVFLVGEKMVSSGLGGVGGPRRWAATPWVLGADSPGHTPSCRHLAQGLPSPGR